MSKQRPAGGWNSRANQRRNKPFGELADTFDDRARELDASSERG